MLRLRRRKKEHTSSDGSGPDTAGAETGAEASAGPPPGTEEPVTQAHDGAGPGDDAVAVAEQPAATAEEPSAPAEEPTATAAPEPAPSAEPAASTFGPPPPPPEGDVEERLPASFYFEGVVKPSPVPTRDELERQAEADFRAAIAPSLEPLRELVPDASSPDEAIQVLAERQGEALVDEEGPKLSSRDIYRNETSVYYRIRTHFDKPSRRPGLRREWQPPSGLAAPPRESSGRRSSRQR